jgi:hypothetical protein
MRFKDYINEIDFMTFRNNALQGLSMVKPKGKRQKPMSKDELDKWIKKEWERHQKK